MKHCPNCKAETADNFNICWNCNYCFSEKQVIDFEKEMENHRDINCLRCDTKMVYTGLHRFHEGTRWGVLGNLFELFVKKKSFELYACPKCGKVEFFAPLIEMPAVETRSSLDSHLKF